MTDQNLKIDNDFEEKPEEQSAPRIVASNDDNPKLHSLKLSETSSLISPIVLNGCYRLLEMLIVMTIGVAGYYAYVDQAGTLNLF
ncbi:MAG: hypothetical protein JJ964_05365, partial [Rhizobiales bacterium]|nr:hypothetical protein [Hyphomicrobiales bacterium]